MNSLKSIALAGLVAMSVNSSFAQGDSKQHTPQERAERMTERMSSDLNVDQAKKTELMAVNLRFVETSSKLRSDANLSDEARKTEMKAAKDVYNSELSTVLSPEQLVKLEQLKQEKKELRAERKEMTPEERAAQLTERMNQVLALTEQQYTQVSQLNLGVEMKIEAIRNNSEMTPEQKKEFIQGNRKDQMAVLSNILTPEQFDKWKAEKKEIHENND